MVTRQMVGLIALAAVLYGAACKNDPPPTSQPAISSSPAAQSTPDQFAAMRTIFARDCQSCHGQNGAGGPVKLADGTKLKVPTLREGRALRHTDADFVKQITKGGDGMPAFGEKMKPEEIGEMVRFIRKEFQAGAVPPAK